MCWWVDVLLCWWHCVGVVRYWCVDACVMCWCADVFDAVMSGCAEVLMCWCVDVLVWWVDVLMCWCVDVLMCWCADMLSVDVLMRWWLTDFGTWKKNRSFKTSIFFPTAENFYFFPHGPKVLFLSHWSFVWWSLFPIEVLCDGEKK